jgi:predicted TIM-barrel fold metal-dependent hydrolase
MAASPSGSPCVVTARLECISTPHSELGSRPREVVGNDRLLFGTDHPFTDRGAEHVEALPLAKEEIDLILGAMLDDC